MKHKICANCGYFKEIPRGMILCDDCKTKIYAKSQSQKQGEKQVATSPLLKETSEEELKVDNN